jgi:hypothetical protein
MARMLMLRLCYPSGVYERFNPEAHWPKLEPHCCQACKLWRLSLGKRAIAKTYATKRTKARSSYNISVRAGG